MDGVELPYLLSKPFNQYPLNYSPLLDFIELESRKYIPDPSTCPVTQFGLALIDEFSTNASFKLISPLIKSNLLVFSAFYSSIIEDVDPEHRLSVHHSFFNSFLASLSDLISLAQELTVQINQFSDKS